MSIALRSSVSMQGRRMAGARALWRANGMKEEQMGKPIIAIVNSFTQFVPGHTHLHEIGQFVKAEIEKLTDEAMKAVDCLNPGKLRREMLARYASALVGRTR